MEAGLPIPSFFNKTSGIWVVFKKDIYNKEFLSKIGLNDRQLNALLFFKSKGKIVSSEYVKKFKVSDRTSRYDLSELVERKLLVKQGDKKSTRYLFPINFR